MGFLRRPAYYRDFKCISLACTDSCCQQWEIDIDEDTYEYYKNVGGKFGERLKRNIQPPEDDEPAHFIQAERERCPFLNEQNLCDIFINLGEEHLSWICTHHPRYYDWFQRGREAGLGLCCEEAARLVLEAKEGPDFEILTQSEEPDEEKDEETEEEASFEVSLENSLFEIRETFFSMVREGNPCAEHDRKMDLLYRKKDEAQEAYDSLMFGEAPEEEKEEPEYQSSYSRNFWNSDRLSDLIGTYQELEVNDPAWWDLLLQAKKILPEIVGSRTEFEKYYRERMREYDNLLIYFLFRYFLKGREDGLIAEKIQFALLSTSMIELLGIMHWLKNDKLDLRDQIDIVKLYSKEIEYDEENMLAISEFSVE